MSTDGAGSVRANVFQTTRWSLVVRAKDIFGEDQSNALEELCRCYWMPLYAYLRSSGYAQHDSEDLVQGFFASLLRRESLRTVDPDRARFRSFLLGALKHHLADELRKEGSEKRGGQVEKVSLDIEFSEEWLEAQLGREDLSPEQAFDRGWAKTLVQRVASCLRETYAGAERLDLYDEIEPYLFGGTHMPTYEEPAGRLGQSVAAFTMAVKRMREKYASILTGEVSQTVQDPTEVEDEMRYLLSLYAN